MKKILLAVALLQGMAGAAHGTLIFETPPETLLESTTYNNIGINFTTPADFTWKNLQFNFYDVDFNPVASGNLYLVAGAVYKMDDIVDNLIATATGNGSVWAFDSNTTLLPESDYSLVSEIGYADPFETGAVQVIPIGNAPVGVSAIANVYADQFVPIEDIAFTLTGRAASMVPEPATLGLVTLFGGGLLFVRRTFMI